MSIDDVERVQLETILPELRKAVANGVGGQAMASMLGQVESRMALISSEEFTPEGREERRNKSASEAAIIYVESSRLSAKAQAQFDGFLDQGFRSKEDLNTLSVFLTENSKILTDLRQVQIVDEVLDGAEREDYTVDVIPDNVLEEIRIVLQRPDLNQSVIANISAEKSKTLNEALASNDSSDLRKALQDPEIFAATHSRINATRQEMEEQAIPKQNAVENQRTSTIEEVQPDREDAALLAEFSEEFQSLPKTPTELAQQAESETKLR